MTTESFNLYKGKSTYHTITSPVKKCHILIKQYIIALFSSNIDVLIDIGSGRGNDMEFWMDTNIKTVYGLEPSADSIKTAIFRLIKLLNPNNPQHKDRHNNPQHKGQHKDQHKGQHKGHYKGQTKITFIRAIGNMSWHDGSAGLDDKSKLSLTKIFRNNIYADRIHLFWTIHYCMDTKQDFQTLFNNINNNIKTGGKVVISCMNGKLIHKLFQKNNGTYVNKTKDGEVLFELNSHYDHMNNHISPYGNVIGVKLAGAYGLDSEIKENLVGLKFVINYFCKQGYKLILNDNFVDYAEKNNIECMKNYTSIQKKISYFYNIIVLEKIDSQQPPPSLDTTT